MIPEGWREMNLGGIATIITGGTPPTKDVTLWSGSIPFVTPVDLRGQKYITSSERMISSKGTNFSKTIPEGSILFSCIGTIGKVGINKHIVCTNQQVNSLVPKGPVCAEFIYYYLLFKSKKIRILASKQAVPIINKKNFSEISISYPSLPEQEKLIMILSTWDEAIEGMERLLHNSRQRKKALMQQLLTGKRRLPGFEGEWRAFNLGDFCEPRQWPTISSKHFTDTGYPVYGANGKLGYYSAYNHDLDTVAIGCRGACGGVMFIEGYSYINGNAMCLDSININMCDKLFLYYLLSVSDVSKIISGSAQPQITKKDVQNFKIRLPPLSEQKAIVAVLATADEEIAVLERDLDRLREEKKGLMQQLLTGRRRVALP